MTRRALGKAALLVAAMPGAATPARRTGITKITRGAIDLRIPPDTPSREHALDLKWHLPGTPVEETWLYGVTAPFQAGPRIGGLFVNVRRDYGPGIDFEVGNDVVLFDDLSHISARRTVPLTRPEISKNPNTSPPG